jgi:hypothetical protein
MSLDVCGFRTASAVRSPKIGNRLGRTCLAEVACVAKTETILAWYRHLIARKFDGSGHRSYPRRPRVSPEVEALTVCTAKENGSWGYDRIAGALANLGHQVSDQAIGNILKRHAIFFFLHLETRRITLAGITVMNVNLNGTSMSRDLRFRT